jgi:hypothetical protein
MSLEDPVKEVVEHVVDASSKKTLTNLLFLLILSEVGIAAFTVAYILDDWTGNFNDLESRTERMEVRADCLTVHHWTGDDEFEGC